MNQTDHTSELGGTGDYFQTTQWSDMAQARTLDPTRQRLMADILIRRYWRPVYCFLRRKGFDSEDAKDITQGFFHEIVLGRRLIQRADMTRGRFRTYLLTALDRYVAAQFRKANAKKRAPEQSIASVDIKDLENMNHAETEASPEDMFIYTWATEMLDLIISQVEQEFIKEDKEVFWQVFSERVIAPIFTDVPAPAMSEICSKYHIDDEKRASNMIITVKRRFRKAVMRVLEDTLLPDSDVQEELVELISILSAGCAE